MGPVPAKLTTPSQRPVRPSPVRPRTTALLPRLPLHLPLHPLRPARQKKVLRPLQVSLLLTRSRGREISPVAREFSPHLQSLWEHAKGRSCGRIAQSVRALASHARGPVFESPCDHTEARRDAGFFFIGPGHLGKGKSHLVSPLTVREFFLSQPSEYFAPRKKVC